MSKYRHTKSIKNLRPLTIEEVETNRRNYMLREQLGLIRDYDSGEHTQYERMNALFLKASTVYSSLNDYELDRTRASVLIDEGKQIPLDLYNRLIQTKHEINEAKLSI